MGNGDVQPAAMVSAPPSARQPRSFPASTANALAALMVSLLLLGGASPPPPMKKARGVVAAPISWGAGRAASASSLIPHAAPVANGPTSPLMLPLLLSAKALAALRFAYRRALAALPGVVVVATVVAVGRRVGRGSIGPAPSSQRVTPMAPPPLHALPSSASDNAPAANTLGNGRAVAAALTTTAKGWGWLLETI